jgi:hypothetical protein
MARRARERMRGRARIYGAHIGIRFGLDRGPDRLDTDLNRNWFCIGYHRSPWQSQTRRPSYLLSMQFTHCSSPAARRSPWCWRLCTPATFCVGSSRLGASSMTPYVENSWQTCTETSPELRSNAGVPRQRKACILAPRAGRQSASPASRTEIAVRSIVAAKSARCGCPPL